MSARKKGPRYANGRLIPKRYVTSQRIPQEDLEAMIYPDGDIRNLPHVRAHLIEHRRLREAGLLPQIPKHIPWPGV